MMESADLGQRNDAALLGSLNGARLGRILFECQMGARAVVVLDKCEEKATKMPVVQHDGCGRVARSGACRRTARPRRSARGYGS